MTLTVIAFAVGAFGLAYGAWSSFLLRRWARDVGGTRIAIAYKRKVKVDAPMREWLIWARMAAKDRDAAGPGRVIYTAAGTTVMVVRKVKRRTVWKMKLARWTRRSEPKPTQVPAGSGTSSGAPSDGAKAGASS